MFEVWRQLKAQYDVFLVSGPKPVGEESAEEPKLDVHGVRAEPGQAKVPERAAGAPYSLERPL